MLDPRALASRLRELDPSRYHAVALPDFFLDHFLQVPSWRETLPRWEGVHARGGGNVPTPGQHFQAGGNAANTALALARLGVRTHLICRTSPFGRMFLEQTLGARGVDLQHVRADGHLSITTAIEFREERPSNLMLSDAGSLADYGPEALDGKDWTLLQAADMVLLANWSQNRRGTALVQAVAKASRRIMLDTGDMSHRLDDLEQLRAEVLPLQDLDVYALNENELRLLVGSDLERGDDERAAARRLHGQRGDNHLDLHTASFAAAYGPHGEAVVPTFRLEPLRVTGAGDAWNAGNMLGYLANLAPEERLGLANAVAARYVGGKEGHAPTMGEVIAFLEEGPKLNPV